MRTAMVKLRARGGKNFFHDAMPAYCRKIPDGCAPERFGPDGTPSNSNTRFGKIVDESKPAKAARILAEAVPVHKAASGSNMNG